jgi:hypothetical protein
MIPYEIKSGRTLDIKHTLNLKKFIAAYPDDIAGPGGVIYSGEPVDKFKGYIFRNFHTCASLFEHDDPGFTVEF